MFSQAKSSSSSSRLGCSYDVFLSFRGEDTRKHFTDHLYTALVQAGIHTFRDDNELPRGGEISPQLLKAIQESRISIVIFSRGYASSTWCLDELTKIMECKSTKGQTVLPVFYDIDPSNVRKQKKSFAEAFEIHEEVFKNEIEKVNKWRKVLKEAVNLSGWDLNTITNGYESKFIQKIVEDVLVKLDDKHLSVPRHLVGIDSHVDNITSLLKMEKNEVQIVGIYGMPGIGKTTIAKAVFNQFCSIFEGSCFLLNVKVRAEQPNGLVQLQEHLLCDVLKPNIWKVSNEDRGINLIKERLYCKRVLVVLDDVDQQKQLDALVGERSSFGPGSRIIITTRNARLLTQLRVDESYKATELIKEQSLQLFCWHAFKDTSPLEDFEELSNDVVGYCSGLPLALEVLGSSLFKRSIPEWRCAIEKLKKNPDHLIQKKLRIGFDSLDDEIQKGSFLDIACFFIGMDKDYVAKILEGRGFFPEMVINILIERSLVKVNFGNNELVMHDLLRDMGREVIREMSPGHPGNRSRIWFFEDALCVLNKQMGTEIVEGITLDVGDSGLRSLSTKSFTKMRCLKLLKINGIHLTGSFKLLSEELIWLCWLECPLKSLPSNFMLENLVVLDMQYSNIKELWKQKKILNRLKILNLSYSKHLVKTPNLHSSSLEKLMLEGCSSLVEVHQSIGHLKSLVFFNLEGCCRLKNLPESICDLKSLETLNINMCSELKNLPERLGDIESLSEVLADGIENEKLLSSVLLLKYARNLSLRGYSFNQESPSSTSWLTPISLWLLPRGLNLQALLPNSFTDWRLLRELKLDYRGISEDATNCVDFGSLSSLTKLDLSGNQFFNLPAGIGSLPKLQDMNVSNCKNLVCISELPSSLIILDAYNCTSMERVRLPIQSKRRPNLFLRGCQNLKEIEGMDGAGDRLFISSESCYNLSNNCKRSFVEAFRRRQYGYVTDFEFFGGEIPHWFSYRGEGCSTLSFPLPPVFEALVVWVAYDSSIPDFRVIIRNESNGIRLFESLIVQPTGDSKSLVSCIRFSEEEMEGCCGHELKLSFVEEWVQKGKEIKVKECGVHVIVEKTESREGHSEWDPRDIVKQGTTSSSGAGTNTVISSSSSSSPFGFNYGLY